MSGRLIALEGGEAVGKSTQARLLAERLGARLSFEPGATDLGARIRSLVLDRSAPSPADRTEALLMAADRAQHVAEVIRPALDAGIHVVTDRFIGSSLCYQGFGRGLGVDEVLALSLFATGGLRSDVNVLVEVSDEVARGRRMSPGDRIEAEDAAFHRRVTEGYRTLAEEDPAHWVIVNGEGSVEEVAEAVFAAVRERLGV
ncbi:dTMP kinase [Candidatus Poriferisocius sp.]|uniref:dTMP kinase n=1 Tax=Candidatus Poriferisocius sp. TaxID=3101276 RepID=UPI003B5A0732